MLRQLTLSACSAAFAFGLGTAHITAEEWFNWKPQYKYAKNNAFVMFDWVGKNAGSKGRVERKDEDLLYNRKQFKAWGINLCFADCAPEKAIADKRAEFYASMGVNSVRLHKYANGSGGSGILKEGSDTEFDPKKLDRMDYFVAALKKRGIFVKISPVFGSLSLAQDSWDQIPYAKDWGGRPSGRKSVKSGAGAVFFSEELQSLHIKQITNLLRHKNPYTKKTYASDPGIMLVEFVNEESALFHGSLPQLQKSKTLRDRMSKKFAEWLLKRYGNEANDLKRWGKNSLNVFGGHEKMPKDESFKEKRIYPVGNPWYWEPAQINGSQKGRAPRLLDTALFFKELQDEMYQKFDKAVRKTGYKGMVMASNWQAGSASSHYYNLHSDAQYDVLDRHSYFGGKNSGTCSVLRKRMLSAGMQQVEDRAFSLSEWIHVLPNQWGAEGPAIIGAMAWAYKAGILAISSKTATRRLRDHY